MDLCCQDVFSAVSASVTVYASGFSLKNMKHPGGEEQTRIRAGWGGVGYLEDHRSKW